MKGLGERLRHAVAWASFFSSGFVALACEVVWIRKAALVFGATVFAVGTVVGVFFGGLALGSAFFGRVADRGARPLTSYAGLELGVGLLALASPQAFRWADATYGALYPRIGDDPALHAGVRFVLVALLVLPPAFLMGGSLPLLCRRYVQHAGAISSRVGLLYGWNTLGAACGAAAAGFVLIPRVGVDGTLRLAGAVSLLLAALVWGAWRSVEAGGRSEHAAPASSGSAEAPRLRRPDLVLFVLVFFAGVAALASEVLWTRYLSLVVRNTVHTYTFALTVTLLGIAVGSLAARGFHDRTRRRVLLFGALHAGNGVLTLALLLLAPRFLERIDPWDAGTRLAVMLVVLAPPALASGTAFPLAIRIFVERPERAALGVGRVTAIGTLGGVAGSIACGFWWLPSFGLHASLALVAGTSVAVGVGAWVFLERSLAPGVRLWLGGAALFGWLFPLVAAGVRLPDVFLADDGVLIEVREGRGATLTVVERGGVRELRIDRLWQGQAAKTHQVLAAHVPLVLHPEARSVAVVGIGVGHTCRSFLLYPLDELVCVDVEAELIPLVRRRFDATWMDDPRVTLVVDDGRNHLSHSGRTYDVVSLELGQTFRPGVAGFYSREFYATVATCLNPGGLVSQFVPLGAFRPDELRTVVRTFVSVFDGAVLWYNRSELLLIGGAAQPALTVGDVEQRLWGAAVRADLSLSHWGGPARRLSDPLVFLGGFLSATDALRRLGEGAPLHTDERPVLEYAVSAYPRGNEEAAVELVRACLSPPSVLLGAGLAPETARALVALRDRNLADVVAVARRTAAAEVLAAGDPPGAIALLEQALAENPENVETHLVLADCRIALGELDEAAAAFGEALRIDPANAPAHRGLGFVHLSSGQHAEAERSLRRGLELEPDHVEALANLAVVLLARGDGAGAREEGRKALSIDPTNRVAREVLERLGP